MSFAAKDNLAEAELLNDIDNMCASGVEIDDNLSDDESLIISEKSFTNDEDMSGFNLTRSVTYIHGVWYDLTEFKHPGGPVAIKLTKDRDATELFELHHPFSNKVYLEKTLEKYKLSNAEVVKRGLVLDATEEVSDFKWEEKDPFREDLVEAVQGYFQEIADEKGITVSEAIKMPFKWQVFTFIIAVLMVITYGFFVAGHFWTLFVLPWLIFVFSARLMHDGSHFALSRNWVVNQIGTHLAPWAASSSSWYIQHVIGHHAHTNIPDRDPDLYHGPENWRYVPHLPWIPAYSRQHVLWPVIWAGSTITIAFLAELFDSEYYNGVVKIGDRTTSNYQFFFWFRMVLMFVLLSIPTYTVGLMWGAVYFLTVWVILSSIFMAFTQVSHLDEICGTARVDNFWKHQMAVSSDYSTESYLWNILSIGLNCQAIHHAFPTVCSVHFPALYPVFKAVCDKHGVEYQEKSNFLEAFKEYWKVLRLYSHTDEELKKMM